MKTNSGLITRGFLSTAISLFFVSSDSQAESYTDVLTKGTENGRNIHELNTTHSKASRDISAGSKNARPASYNKNTNHAKTVYHSK